MGIVERSHLDALSLGMFEHDSKLLDVARRVSHAGDLPVVGGVAVFLHGYRRTTEDVDVFTTDAARDAARLEQLGAVWDESLREHTLDGVPVHMVTLSQTRSEPTHISEIDGVRVVGLVDLIRFKLASGLGNIARAKDLADVVELIRRVPLDKAFAGKLPTDLRSDFKRLVDAVDADTGRANDESEGV